MMGTSRAIRVWAWPEPVDLRKGFDGLVGLVGRYIRRDPLTGDYFLFVSRSRQSAKVLLWDGTGLCIYQKRLSHGRFARLWTDGSPETIRLTMSELSLYLEGANLAGRLPLSPEEVQRRVA